MQKVIFRAQGNGSLSRPFILEVDHQFDKNSPFMVEIEANYEGFERVNNYFAFSNNSEVMLLSYLKLVDNHYIEHETEHALARTFIATDKNHVVDGPFVVSVYNGITYLSKMQLHDGFKVVNSEFIKIPEVASLQEWADKINKGIGIYIIGDLTGGIVYYTRGEVRNFLSGPVIVEVIAIDEHSEPGKSYQYIRVLDAHGNEAIGYFDVVGLSDFVETASDPLVAAVDYILPIVKREIIDGGAVAPYAEESGKTTRDDLDRKISDTYHVKKEDLIIEAASPNTPSPQIRMRAHGETEVEEYNIQALTDGSLKIEKTDLNQAPFVIKSDGTVEIEKLESPSFDTKVDKPAGSPNNYFSESNEYLPLQRFARVRYQSTSGWAKVAEVTLPASADERKSAIFFINCENNTSTTSESWFGILEWNIHEAPASNSIKWLVTYGFGENNFNIRYHSDTNTLSFFVLPSVGNMNLWLASESTNGYVTSDIVLFDATDSTSRTGLSVAAKADYLTHAGHVRNTRKVADIVLSGDISKEALINALKASDPSDTDKLTTVGIVADMFAELVNGAPAALDTLQELAQALNDDPNFATTMSNLIGTKLSKVDAQNTYETIVNSDNKLALKADKTYIDAELSLKENIVDNDNKLALKADDIIMENLIEDGAFTQGTTHWMPLYNNTIETTAEGLLVTGSGENEGLTIQTRTAVLFSTSPNDLYYRFFKAKVLDDGATRLFLRNFGTSTSDLAVNDPIKDTWYSLSDIVTKTEYVNNRTFINARWANAEEALNKRFVVNTTMTLNLTETFGAGNEPTKEQMDALLNSEPFFEHKQLKLDELIKQKANTFTLRNLVPNGDLLTAKPSPNENQALGFTYTNLTDITLSGGIAKFTATAQYARILLSNPTNIFNSNDVFYNFARFKSSRTNVTISTPIGAGISHSGSGNFEFLSTCGKFVNIYTIAQITDRNTGDWTEVEADYIGAINLTETFGAGNEPSQGVMDLLINRYGYFQELTLNLKDIFSLIQARGQRYIPTLSNGATSNNVFFTKDQNGFVDISGQITVDLGDNPSITAFNLPSNYRLALAGLFPGMLGNGTHIQVYVGSNGDIVFYNSGTIHISIRYPAA